MNALMAFLVRVAFLVRGRRSRRDYLGLALAGACATLAVVALGSVVFAAEAEHPESVTAQVTSCDLHAAGSARVTFTLANGDRVLHAYRVIITVAEGSTTLGTSVTLVNHVAAGTTSDARALVPISTAGPRARCSVRAETFTGDIGHYGGGH